MTWYRRLGDIPGYSYRPLVGIEPELLSGRDFEPTPRPDDTGTDGLYWPCFDAPNILSGQSPAVQHLGLIHDTRVSSHKVVKNLSEALELPATARDYHTMLTRSIESLWHKRRRCQPGALRALEYFSLLDIQLFRLVPDVLMFGAPLSLENLVRLYVSEGLLAEARAVARESEQLTTESGAMRVGSPLPQHRGQTPGASHRGRPRMTETFGARYAQLADMASCVEFERAHERRREFELVDEVIDRLMRSALAGGSIISVTQPEVLGEHHDVQLTLDTDVDREVLTEHFEVTKQEARGAWYLPTEAELAVGIVELARWMREEPRFALTAASADVAKASFESMDPIVVWAALEPVFDALYAPLQARRGYYIGMRKPEWVTAMWEDTIDPAYRALGVGADALSRFRAGSGWSGLDSSQVIERRLALVESWAAADIDAPVRLRAWRIGQLVARYYEKAKNGRALRRRVMTRQLERTLTAYFAGDWMSFLRFIGQDPHPKEELTTAVAEPKLVGVQLPARADEVAAAHGVSAEHLRMMLGAFWQGIDGESPIEARARVLTRFWAELDEALATHDSPGELRELLRENPPILAGEARPPGDVESRRRLGELQGRYLSAELRSNINRLWGTTMLPQWPQRRVSQPWPYGAFADAVGPAFTFWTELWPAIYYGGGRSLDTLGRGDGRLARVLAELAVLGCPVDVNIEGLPSVDFGSIMNPDGALRVRDLLTRHRRRWAETHLGRYVEARWRADLTDAAEAFSRIAANKGRDPTPKQFAPGATDAANRWFGGDLVGVYRATGLNTSFETTADLRMPADRWGFVNRVQTLLEADVQARTPSAANTSGAETSSRPDATSSVAGGAVRWVQLFEALGHAPQVTHYGQFEYPAKSLGLDVGDAWAVFSSAVERALAELSAGPNC